MGVMRLVHVVGLLALATATAQTSDDGDFDAEGDALSAEVDETTTFVVEHSFGQGFSPRSEVVLSISKASKSITAKVAEPSYRFTSEDTSQFRQLVKRDGFYSVRVQTVTGSYVVASVRACSLQRDWHEIINFHVGKGGELIAMDFAAPYDQRPCGGVDVTEGMQQIKLTTMAKLKLPSDAPPVQSFQGPAPLAPQPAAAKKAKGNDGEQPAQNQSFFRKYWYIILPVVLMSFLQSPEEPEAGKGGAPGGGNKGGGGKKKR